MDPERIRPVTTAKTLKTLRKAFKDFEAAYVGVEAVCREPDRIDSYRTNKMMTAMRAAHVQFRLIVAEVERHAKEEKEST
jgi:hypothetical protein